MIPTADTSKTIPLLPVKNSEGKQEDPQKPYMRYQRPQLRTCRLNAEFCSAPSSSRHLEPDIDPFPCIKSADADRIAKHEFHCGDCLLELLMQHPGHQGGMGAILPKDERSAAFLSVTRRRPGTTMCWGRRRIGSLLCRVPSSRRTNSRDCWITGVIFPSFVSMTISRPTRWCRPRSAGCLEAFWTSGSPLSSPWERPGSLPEVPGSNS